MSLREVTVQQLNEILGGCVVSVAVQGIQEKYGPSWVDIGERGVLTLYVRDNV